MTITLKLKPDPAPLAAAPFSWDNLPASPTVSSPSEPPPSPPTQWLDARHMKIFGAEPLRPEFGVVTCTDCGKPVLQSAIGDHIEKCRALRTAGKKGSKADEEASSKKKKPAPKITKGRAKGPIDLDRQCGVINDKGMPCSRALTCKSHSMGAKRSVQGRSKNYDELLNDFNKERNPNYVEPVKRQSKAERKEKKEKEKAEKKAAAAANAVATGGAVKKGKKPTAPSQPAATAVQQEPEDENMDDVDSEVELDLMIKAVRQAQSAGLIGRPMASPYDAGTWFVARRERLRNCKDLLAGALAPRTVIQQNGIVPPPPAAIPASMSS